MATFYEEAAATALESISEFGRELTLRRIYKTANAVEGSNDPVASEDQKIKCLVLPISQTANQAIASSDNRLLKDALITGKLRFLLIAAASAVMEPAPNDVSFFDGGWWQVLGCTPLSPAGTPILYKVAVMQSSVTEEDAEIVDLLALEEAAAAFSVLVNTDLGEAFPGA